MQYHSPPRLFSARLDAKIKHSTQVHSQLSYNNGEIYKSLAPPQQAAAQQQQRYLCVPLLHAGSLVYSRVSCIHGSRVFTGLVYSRVSCIHGSRVFTGRSQGKPAQSNLSYAPLGYLDMASKLFTFTFTFTIYLSLNLANRRVSTLTLYGVKLGVLH